MAATIGMAGSANAQQYRSGWDGHRWVDPSMMRGYNQGGDDSGSDMIYGHGPSDYGNQSDLNLTVDQVKKYLRQMIGNPNLKVGEVKEKDANTIVADIVTKKGNALVQRLGLNRHNGFVQLEQ